MVKTMRVMQGKLYESKVDAIAIPVDEKLHHLPGISEYITKHAGK